MSFLHTQSEESMKSELDLFGLPVTQTNLERGDWIPYKPIAALNDSAPLEFVIPGRGSEYIDISQTLLSIQAKITSDTGLKVADDVAVGPVNNWLHSMFQQVDIFLNGKLVSPPTHTYSYRSYIETVLNYDVAAKMSHLTSRLWYKDTAGKMDDLKDNLGLKKRMSFTDGGKTVDLVGNIHADMFSQGRFLLNGVEMRIKLVRSKDAFHLMSDKNTVKSSIIDATLYVRKVQVNPSILIAHNRTLEKINAKYPITRVEIKTVTIPAGLQSKTLDNLFMGQLPKRIILGLVTNTAFNGDFGKNPFNFQHFGLNFASMYVDGQQVPAKPLQPDFDNKQYIMAYHTLYSGTGIHFKDEGNNISREEYPDGYFLLAFDLTPDLSASSDHWCLQRNGSLRVDIRFNTSLTETIDCILYAEFDNLLEIDRNRNVIVDYSN